jgi:hypothetical protein
MIKGGACDGTQFLAVLSAMIPIPSPDTLGVIRLQVRTLRKNKVNLMQALPGCSVLIKT